MKKGGGKALDKKTRFVNKWHKRWFVLPPTSTVLSYYKSEAASNDGKEALGSIDCAGAVLFLKEVVKGQYRFTIKTAARELKLRAQSAGDFEQWMAVLQPIAASSQEDDTVSERFDSMARDISDAIMEEDEIAASDDDDDPDDFRGVRNVSLSSAAPPLASTPGKRGQLEKKSGGKAAKKKSFSARLVGDKWSKRWFVLPASSSTLSYYKSESEQNNGKEALGTIELQGSKVFLKEVDKKGVHRFTIKSSARELKLRATNEDEYNSWVAVFRPFVASFEDDPTESVRGTLNNEPDDFDDDDDDSD